MPGLIVSPATGHQEGLARLVTRERRVRPPWELLLGEGLTSSGTLAGTLSGTLDHQQCGSSCRGVSMPPSLPFLVTQCGANLLLIRIETNNWGAHGAATLRVVKPLLFLAALELKKRSSRKETLKGEKTVHLRNAHFYSSRFVFCFDIQALSHVKRNGC